MFSGDGFCRKQELKIMDRNPICCPQRKTPKTGLVEIKDKEVTPAVQYELLLLTLAGRKTVADSEAVAGGEAVAGEEAAA